MKFLLFEAPSSLHSATVARTKKPSDYRNVGKDREYGKGDYLFGVSGTSVCFPKGAPAYQRSMPLHYHPGSMPLQIPALSCYGPRQSCLPHVLLLKLDRTTARQLIWHSCSLSHIVQLTLVPC